MKVEMEKIRKELSLVIKLIPAFEQKIVPNNLEYSNLLLPFHF